MDIGLKLQWAVHSYPNADQYPHAYTDTDEHADANTNPDQHADADSYSYRWESRHEPWFRDRESLWLEL
jgi:hypothetical protein